MINLKQKLWEIQLSWRKFWSCSKTNKQFKVLKVNISKRWEESRFNKDNKSTPIKNGPTTFLKDEILFNSNIKKVQEVSVKKNLRSISKSPLQIDRQIMESLRRILRKLAIYLIEELVSRIIIRDKNIMIWNQEDELCMTLCSISCMVQYTELIVESKIIKG